MPPAAKKKRLTPSAAEASSSPGASKSRAPQPLVGMHHDVVVRCKQTGAYANTYRATTLVAAKQANRRLGTNKWYCLNKDALVTVIVLNRFAKTIVNFFREKVVAHARREHGDGGLGHAGSSVAMCPISCEPLADIPLGLRFKHTNVWFNKTLLAQHMSKTSDFLNPVTRIEFGERDVIEIDPRLVKQFRKRKELRASLASHMAMVQSIENELEEVFQLMVEAAEEIRSRREFRIVFDNLSEDFQECREDLVELDTDRSVLALKSLRDLIKGDPNHRPTMSKKREGILRSFLENQCETALLL